jgi:hypothetical protein
MENEEYIESFEDCKESRLIFIQALDALLPPGTGVFVELHGEALESGFKRVIIHSNPDNNEIGVILAEERTDLKHGDRVKIINEDLLKN